MSPSQRCPRPRAPRAFRLAGLAAVLALAAGCAKQAEAPSGPVQPARPEDVQAATVSMWRSQFDAHKEQWNAVMTSDDASPLPEDRRASFPGLAFYAYDPAWRYVGDLERLRPPGFIQVPDTKGRAQAYLDYGRFPIERNGVVATLEVYRPVEHPEQFFIAFFDSTNGSETYAGGRYAHLDSLDTHRFVLDFNQAYNPYCAYDSSWMCPIPPRANALPFAVRAGMMNAPGAH